MVLRQLDAKGGDFVLTIVSLALESWLRSSLLDLRRREQFFDVECCVEHSTFFVWRLAFGVWVTT